MWDFYSKKKVAVSQQEFTLKQPLLVNDVSRYLVLIGAFLLLAGYPLTILSGDKYHYYIFAACCAVVAMLTFRPTVSIIKVWYFVPLLLSLAYNLLSHSIDKSFVLSILPYVIIPAIFFSRIFTDFPLDQFMKLFEYFTILNFIGLLLQINGIQSPFLQQGILYSVDGPQLRFGSFSGGTLGLGFVGSISAINSFYRIIYLKERTWWNIIVLVLAWSTLLIGLSRRFYLLTFGVMTVIWIFGVNRNVSKTKIIKFAIYSIVALAIVLYLLYTFQGDSLLLKRAFSVADFENDDSNALRLVKWITAIESFLNNIWMGKGIGSAGMIGHVLEEGDSVEDLNVAESYYLKVFVECGVFVGTIFLGLMISFFRNALSGLRDRKAALPAAIVIFFCLDCLMSTSLEGPIGALLFWLSCGMLFFRKRQELKLG